MGILDIERFNSSEGQSRLMEFEPLVIKGIECKQIVHLSQHYDVLNIGRFSNLPDVIEWLDRKDPVSLLMDGFNSSHLIEYVVSNSDPNVLQLKFKQDFQTFRGDGNTPDVVAIFDKLASKKDTLLFGDFISEYGSENEKKYSQKELALSATGVTVGTISAAAIEAKILNIDFSRRKFLKLAGLSIGSLLGGVVIERSLSYGINSYRNSSIDKGNYDTLLAKVEDKFNDPGLGDSVVRTGLAIAKHSKMNEELNLAGSEAASQDQLQLWGDAHFNAKEDLKLIKEIADNPFPPADKILKREMAFLIAKGVPMSEATEKVATLRVAMASIIPCDITTNPDGLLFTISRRPFEDYLDDRILGFRSTGMEGKEIRQMARGLAYNTYFEMTDRNGDLVI